MSKKHDISALLQAALEKGMSWEEREAQRRSFAYGNLAVDKSITREAVDKAADALASRTQPEDTMTNENTASAAPQTEEKSALTDLFAAILEHTGKKTPTLGDPIIIPIGGDLGDFFRAVLESKTAELQPEQGVDTVMELCMSIPLDPGEQLPDLVVIGDKVYRPTQEPTELGAPVVEQKTEAKQPATFPGLDVQESAIMSNLLKVTFPYLGTHDPRMIAMPVPVDHRDAAIRLKHQGFVQVHVGWEDDFDVRLTTTGIEFVQNFRRTLG